MNPNFGLDNIRYNNITPNEAPFGSAFRSPSRMPLEALRSAAHVTVDAKSLAVGDGGNEDRPGMEKSWEDLWEVHVFIIIYIYTYSSIYKL